VYVEKLVEVTPEIAWMPEITVAGVSVPDWVIVAPASENAML
jgi:hypothetical protein